MHCKRTTMSALPPKECGPQSLARACACPRACCPAALLPYSSPTSVTLTFLRTIFPLQNITYKDKRVKLQSKDDLVVVKEEARCGSEKEALKEVGAVSSSLGGLELALGN